MIPQTIIVEYKNMSLRRDFTEAVGRRNTEFRIMITIDHRIPLKQ